MSTSIRHHRLHATNAEESTSIKHSSCEKHQDYLPGQEHLPTFPSQFLAAKNAAMSMQSSYQKKFNPSTSYDGLHIYDLEGDE
jgi:hypothetical protein